MTHHNNDIVWEGGGVKRRMVEIRPGEYAPEVAVFQAAEPLLVRLADAEQLPAPTEPSGPVVVRVDETAGPVSVKAGETLNVRVVEAPAAPAPAAAAEDPLTAALKAGRMYVAGKAINVPSGGQASDRCALRVENPTTSGVLLTVLAFTVYSSMSQQVRYRSGGTVSPANALTGRSLNLAVANVASKAVVQWSNVAASGGTFWDSESRVDPAAPLQLDFPRGLILGPGNALTLDTGSTGPQVTTVNVYWVETPLSG
jgi:hypothetical protein